MYLLVFKLLKYIYLWEPLLWWDMRSDLDHTYLKLLRMWTTHFKSHHHLQPSPPLSSSFYSNHPSPPSTTGDHHLRRTAENHHRQIKNRHHRNKKYTTEIINLTIRSLVNIGGKKITTAIMSPSPLYLHQ